MVIIQITNKVFIDFLADVILLDPNTFLIYSSLRRAGLL